MDGAEKVEGGRYVMPIALCRPVISRFAFMKAMVTSPKIAPGADEGSEKRMMESGRLSEKMGRAWTREGSKCFQPRIFFAAAG